MSFFQRVRDVLGLDDLYDDYEYEDEGISLEGETGIAAGNQSRKLIGMPGLAHGQSEMILMQPQSFDEMPDAVTALRERRSVILDLSMIDIEHAQRCADYVAGGTFAMDGHYRQIGHNVFLFTPNSVHISHRTFEETAQPVPVQAAPPKASPKPESEKSTQPRRHPIADPFAL
ncbi:MAG: cell division protein SepF [Timaviella obliquedivisa GSE-PSE-MK23-08B]|jgi:cell division inhibitor SepF|nr:cell division protein SepF [Timaviella obliquedivisa GSE-PSE-MK23-08B]